MIEVEEAVKYFGNCKEKHLRRLSEKKPEGSCIKGWICHKPNKYLGSLLIDEVNGESHEQFVQSMPKIEYLNDEMDICIVSSGLYSDRLSEIAKKYGWSYLSTKRNSVTLTQNTAIKLFPLPDPDIQSSAHTHTHLNLSTQFPAAIESLFYIVHKTALCVDLFFCRFLSRLLYYLPSQVPLGSGVVAPISHQT